MNSEEGVQVVVLGHKWLTHLGRCDVLPWVGGWGAVGYGPSPRALWDFTLRVHGFLYVVFSSSFLNHSSPAGRMVFESVKCHLFSLNFHTSVPLLRRFFTLSWLALVWSGQVWGGFVFTVPLLFWPPSNSKRWLSFIQFVYKFDHSCVKFMHWNCLWGAQAKKVKLL